MALERAKTAETSTEEISQELSIVYQLGGHAAKEIVGKTKVLEAIANGSVTKEQFREFALQRNLAAQSFEELLTAGIATATKANDKKLAAVLQANLNDEMGIDAHGQKHPDQAHETWRKDFYTALGITEDELKTAEPLKGTKDYCEAIKALIEERNYVKIAAVIFALEFSIPMEFRKIAEGRDKIFPEIFTIQENEIPAEMIEKVRAKVMGVRQYLDDHIQHDTKSHATDLAAALSQYVSTRTSFKEGIYNGINAVIDAKQKFYKSLEQALGL